jgi:hypothetical protein
MVEFGVAKPCFAGQVNLEPACPHAASQVPPDAG